IKDMCVFPIAFDEVLNESFEKTVQRLAKADSLLTKHLTIISGIGQGLLAVSRMNKNGVNQAALSKYAGLLTRDIHAIANDVLTSCHSGHLLIDLESVPHLAGEVIQGLENLYISHPVVEGLGLFSSLSSPATLATHFVDDNHVHVYQHAWDAFMQHLEKTPDTSMLVQHLDQAGNHAGNMLEVIHGGIHAHFPGFTLARSAYREFRLLRDKKTSWDRSLKHMVVD